jgi:PAS domain S-box-containing protein
MDNNDHIYQSREFQKFFSTAKRSLVLKANAPVFTILAASDLYLELTHKHRDEVLGHGLFQVYPGNHADPTEKDSVFSSFKRVIDTTKRDELPVFKYEIAIEGSLFKETHYWTNENEPILDDNGQVAYIINTTTNITEEIRQSQALQESEDRFKVMAEGTDVMISVGNRLGEAIYFNQAWNVATGRKVGELLKFGWVDLIHEDDRDVVMDKFRIAFKNKASWTSEFRILSEDGSYRWLLTNGVPRFSNDEEFAGYISSSVDITPRKNFEISLKQYNERLEIDVNDRTLDLKKSRDQLQSIVDTTLMQISVLEAVRDTNSQIIDFQIKSVNKELERVTGRTDLPGKRYLTEFPGIMEVGIFDLIVKTIQTGAPQQMEYYYAHEGFMNWFNCMFVKLNDGVVATNIDITARKQAEDDRFKNYVLLQQSEDITLLGSWDFDLFTLSFTWSEGMYRLFEIEKGLEIGPEIYLEYATDNGRAAAERIVNYISNGNADFEEILEINVSGRVKVLHLKAAIVRSESGRVERVLGVDMDMTAIYAAEEKIRKMEIEQQLEIFRVSLSTLEEERHRISESLHNGIAQILYGIKLNISTLNQELPRTNFNENKAYVSKLLTDAINETRRISHELMPSTLEQFGLKSAILDICSQLSGSTKFKCTIMGLGSGMEKYLELAIYRTTQELMTNVVKHAKATKCMVIINIEQQSIRIQVNDNGDGMENKDVTKPGIGLASIRSKIKLLNGTVDIDSVQGKGTSIEIVIPWAQSAAKNL